MTIKQHERLADLAMGCVIFLSGFLAALVTVSVMLAGHA
ncbi:serine hydrolase [Acetobacter orientalis]|uniref:Serine hydrolase n=1 Tax=Acetobacter orientalis TaxID=146474 RepID=A0A2Z5ZLR2_9PROT|nr:serine hydrolase [Acetobacter orientalis]